MSVKLVQFSNGMIGVTVVMSEHEWTVQPQEVRIPRSVKLVLKTAYFKPPPEIMQKACEVVVDDGREGQVCVCAAFSKSEIQLWCHGTYNFVRAAAVLFSSNVPSNHIMEYLVPDVFELQGNSGWMRAMIESIESPIRKDAVGTYFETLNAVAPQNQVVDKAYVCHVELKVGDCFFASLGRIYLDYLLQIGFGEVDLRVSSPLNIRYSAAVSIAQGCANPGSEFYDMLKNMLIATEIDNGNYHTFWDLLAPPLPPVEDSDSMEIADAKAQFRNDRVSYRMEQFANNVPEVYTAIYHYRLEGDSWVITSLNVLDEREFPIYIYVFNANRPTVAHPDPPPKEYFAVVHYSGSGGGGHYMPMYLVVPERSSSGPRLTGATGQEKQFVFKKDEFHTVMPKFGFPSK